MIDTEIKVTPQLAAEHGLTPEEYARIQKILGRDPNFTELGIFSVMWSEHCSYKSSRVHLKRLPTRGRTWCRAPAKMPASWTSATAWSPSSRSNRTIIPATSSRFRARPPASAESCATFSPWARGRSPCSIRCASARSRQAPARPTPPPKKSRATAACSMAWSAASPSTEIVSACPPSAAKSPSSRATPKIRWSTCWRSASAAARNYFSPAPAAQAIP